MNRVKKKKKKTQTRKKWRVQKNVKEMNYV